MGRKNQRVTIQDVADTAGVSVSTVSRVLNEKDDIAPDTYQKVKEVIRELGYTSSLAARSMRSRRTNVIGLIMPDVEQSFPIMVMKGVNRAIAKLDYDLIVYTGGDWRKYHFADRQRQHISLLNNSITDGVIVVTPAASSFPTVAPIVAVDHLIDHHEYPTVISKNREGALKVIAYLIELGHRRIGFIGGRKDLQSAYRRLLGYEHGLQTAGIQIDPELIQDGDFTFERGYQATVNLMSLQVPPTASFAANDQSAFGVYSAAREMGVRIPQDLSVVGFDNTPESAVSEPRLTTIDQSVEEMGYKATQVLIELVNGKQLETDVFKVSTSLVVRDSCRTIG